MKRRDLLQGLAALALPLPALCTEEKLHFTFVKDGVRLVVSAGTRAALDAGRLALEPAWRTRSLIAVDFADLTEFCGAGSARAEATFSPGYRDPRITETQAARAFWACRLARDGLTLDQVSKDVESVITLAGDRPAKISTYLLDPAMAHLEGLAVLQFTEGGRP